MKRMRNSVREVLDSQVTDADGWITQDVVGTIRTRVSDIAVVSAFKTTAERHSADERERMIEHVFSRAHESLLAYFSDEGALITPKGAAKKLTYGFFGGWWSLDLVLRGMRQSLNGTALPPLKEGDIALTDELAREICDLAEACDLPVLHGHNMLAGTPASDAHACISILSSEEIDLTDTNLFAIKRASLHFGNACEWTPAKSDFVHQTGCFIFPDFTTMWLNVNGEGMGLFTPSGVPVVSLLHDPELRMFYHQLRLRMMLEFRELYGNVFNAIESGNVKRSSDGSKTILPIPRTVLAEPLAQPDPSQKQEIELPVEKLQQQVIAHKRLKLHLPALTANKILRSLQRLGCRVVRQTGSHMLVEALNGQRRVLPQHGKRVIGIGSVTDALRAFGISREDFLEHL